MGSLRRKEGEEEMSCKLEHEKGCQYHTAKVEENKSWDEFIKWVHNNSKYYKYEYCNNYEKIGLLIEYLKSIGLRHEKEIVLSDLEVKKLEAKVKSLKPKEDDEIERVANELRKSYLDAKKTNSIIINWDYIARKAIEIIRGEI